MKEKISLFVMALILILPVTLYAVFKAPYTNAAYAAVKEKPIVLEFSTPLCSECQKLKKILATVEPKYQNKIAFQKINAAMMDKDTLSKVQKYDIKVVPTTIFIDKTGNVVDRIEGSMQKAELENKLNELAK